MHKLYLCLPCMSVNLGLRAERKERIQVRPRVEATYVRGVRVSSSPYESTFRCGIRDCASSLECLRVALEHFAWVYFSLSHSIVSHHRLDMRLFVWSLLVSRKFLDRVFCRVFCFYFSFSVLLEDEQKIGLGVFDRTIFIPMFRPPIPTSCACSLGKTGYLIC